MTPLGLLHYLWRKAGLTFWQPKFAGKRDPRWLIKQIAQAAEQIMCGRVPLAEQLAFVAPQAWDYGKRFVEWAPKSGRRRYLVLIGIVQGVEPGHKGQRRVTLEGAWPEYSLFLSGETERMDALLQSYPYAARLLALQPVDRPGRIIGVFVVTATADRWKDKAIIKAHILLGGLMETTRDFIPVASDLERQVADELVAKKRVFNKSVRFDASEALVFPDFELLDAGVDRGLPMEVFGRDDEDYRTRRGEKIEYYQRTYGLGEWWSWIAAGPMATPMPSLPPKS